MTVLNNIHKSLIVAPEFNYIHLFTDYKDEYFDCKNSYLDAFEKAEILKNKWLLDGVKNIRMYHCIEYTCLYNGIIETEKEDCIFSIGDYPM